MSGREARSGVRAVGLAAGHIIAMCAFVLLIACSAFPDEETPSPRSTTTAKIAQAGQEVFVSNCAVCHGLGGEEQRD